MNLHLRHFGCTTVLAGTMALAAGSVLTIAARAESAPPPRADTATPAKLSGVDVTERLGVSIPLDLRFTNDHGTDVRLGEYFDGNRPVLLTMNYSSCPMLCSLQINGLVDALSEMAWTAGTEFEMVTVSIDPRESTRIARLTKEKYLQDYGRPEAEDGWHFLTGEETDIQVLADQLGFGFRYLPDQNEYAHAAVTYVMTPDGVLSRNLYGVLYDPQTVRLSLVEASEGKVGSTIDKILLFCFRYDATEGRYGPAARQLMKAGGAFTVLCLGLVAARIWRRERQAVAEPEGQR